MTIDITSFRITRSTVMEIPCTREKRSPMGLGASPLQPQTFQGPTDFDLLRVTMAPGEREQAPIRNRLICRGTRTWPGTRRARAGSAHLRIRRRARVRTQLPRSRIFRKISFWPGDFVLGASGDTNSAFGAATLTIDSLVAQVVSVAGANKPVVFADSCGALGNWTPAWIVCAAQNYPPSAFYEQGALVMAVKPTGDGGKAAEPEGSSEFFDSRQRARAHPHPLRFRFCKNHRDGK